MKRIRNKNETFVPFVFFVVIKKDTGKIGGEREIKICSVF